jgi:hypothetical protein
MLPSPCAGPTDNSHYVDGREARLICGACPSSATSFEDRIKIADALIVGCGVRVFYDLMNDAERKQIGCVDYRGDMDFTLKAHLQAHSADFEEDICFGGEQHKDADNKEQIIYRRYPVKDHHAFSSDASHDLCALLGWPWSFGHSNDLLAWSPIWVTFQTGFCA